MRIVTKPTSNTEKAILRQIAGRPSRPEEIVLRMWPSTKQPDKKHKTIIKYLRFLIRRGLVKEINGLFFSPRIDGPGGGRRLRLAA